MYVVTFLLLSSDSFENRIDTEGEARLNIFYSRNICLLNRFNKNYEILEVILLDGVSLKVNVTHNTLT
jgi:hypothetical protein